MKIALVGASGFVGGAVLKEAISRGHTVTAIARNAARISTGPNVTVEAVEVADTGRLGEIFAGNDVVISAFNGGWGDSDIYAKHLKGSRDIAEAAKSAGKRLIVVGGAGSLHAPDGSQFVDLPDFPAEWRDGARAARDVLAELRQDDWKDWTFVSPAFVLAPGTRTGKYRLGGESPVFDEKGESHISVEDLAVALVDEAETPSHIGKRFTLGY